MSSCLRSKRLSSWGKLGMNNLTMAHKKSRDVHIASPDVFKTPTPGGPIPMPYPNVVQSSDTLQGSQKATWDEETLPYRVHGKAR